jgi:hypothetical protein
MGSPSLWYPRNGSLARLVAIVTADSDQETGFITWTHHGQPVGMYVPAPTGKPLYSDLEEVIDTAYG